MLTKDPKRHAYETSMFAAIPFNSGVSQLSYLTNTPTDEFVIPMIYDIWENPMGMDRFPPVVRLHSNILKSESAMEIGNPTSFKLGFFKLS